MEDEDAAEMYICNKVLSPFEWIESNWIEEVTAEGVSHPVRSRYVFRDKVIWLCTT